MRRVSTVAVFFFFFQAEDGIRDADVTGVQTCALPICSSVTDLIAVEILVLESLEEALDDAVGLGRAVADTDVGELGAGGDVTSQGGPGAGGAGVGDAGDRETLPALPAHGLPRWRGPEPGGGVHS